MQYYLETNSIRQLAGKISDYDCEVFTSELSIFELISGIDSFEKYNRRRNILMKIADSKIRIDWSTYKEKAHHSYGIPCFDKRKYITEIMMNVMVF